MTKEQIIAQLIAMNFKVSISVMWPGYVWRQAVHATGQAAAEWLRDINCAGALVIVHNVAETKAAEARGDDPCARVAVRCEGVPVVPAEEPVSEFFNE